MATHTIGTTSYLKTATEALDLLQQVVQQDPHAPIRIEIAASYRSGFSTETHPVAHVGNKPELQEDGTTPGPALTENLILFQNFPRFLDRVCDTLAEGTLQCAAHRRIIATRIVSTIRGKCWELDPGFHWHENMNAISALVLILEQITDQAVWDCGDFVDGEGWSTLEVEELVHDCRAAIVQAMRNVLRLMTDAKAIWVMNEKFIRVPNYLRTSRDSLGGVPRSRALLNFVTIAGHRNVNVL